mmetsp:Transcript_7057/g.24491  ORF Transcript_7057/g.24491 Transcript_7057/m.24491 type:complete len:220 (-) Transcript_7057:43-702(-)
MCRPASAPVPYSQCSCFLLTVVLCMWWVTGELQAAHTSGPSPSGSLGSCSARLGSANAASKLSLWGGHTLSAILYPSCKWDEIFGHCESLTACLQPDKWPGSPGARHCCCCRQGQGHVAFVHCVLPRVRYAVHVDDLLLPIHRLLLPHLLLHHLLLLLLVKVIRSHGEAASRMRLALDGGPHGHLHHAASAAPELRSGAHGRGRAGSSRGAGDHLSRTE